MLKGTELENGMTHYVCPKCGSDFYHKPSQDTCGYCTREGLQSLLLDEVITITIYDILRKELK